MTRAVLVVDGRKPCGRSDCTEENPQPVENFHRSSKTASGYKSYCRTCRKRESAPEVRREYYAARYLANRQARLLEEKQRYADDPERKRRQASTWAKANRTLVNERFRRYRIEGRYKELDRASAALRRARLANVEVEKIDLIVLFSRDEGLCGLCGESVDEAARWPDPRSASLDHKIPVSRGGPHTWANVQLAHLFCNMKKGNRV